MVIFWFRGYMATCSFFCPPALHPSFLGQDCIWPCMKCLFRSNRRCQYLSNLTYLNYSGALLGVPNAVFWWIILDLSVSCLSLESFKYVLCSYMLMLAFQGVDLSLKGWSSFPELWPKEVQVWDPETKANVGIWVWFWELKHSRVASVWFAVALAGDGAQ